MMFLIGNQAQPVLALFSQAINIAKASYKDMLWFVIFLALVLASNPAFLQKAPGATYVLVVLFNLIAIVILSVGILASIHDRLTGKAKNLEALFNQSIKLFVPMLVTMIMIWLPTFLGGLFFVLPGMIVFAFLWLAGPFVVIEDKKPLEAIKASLELVKKHWQYALGSYAIFMIATVVVASAANFLILLIAQLLASTFVGFVLLSIVYIILLSFAFSYQLALYYNLRIKEHGQAFA